MRNNEDRKNDVELSESIEDIANQDWPLLKELEETRFSLKKKSSKQPSQSLVAVKEITDREDEEISDQKLIDEKLVEEFLETRKESISDNTRQFTTPKIKEVAQEEVQVKQKVTQPVVEVIEATNDSDLEPMPAPVQQPKRVVQTQVAQNPQVASVKKENAEDVSRLIAIGLVKIYINKTDSILNPLRFIINNATQIIIALFQFLIPGMIAWYLTNNVPTVANEMAKEPIHIKLVYGFIFYFACLFIWISGQVMLSGLWNMLKYTANNLAKAGKN